LSRRVALPEWMPVKRSFRQIVAPSKQIAWNLILISAGSMVCCAAVNGILIPKEFFGAGYGPTLPPSSPSFQLGILPEPGLARVRS